MHHMQSVYTLVLLKETNWGKDTFMIQTMEGKNQTDLRLSTWNLVLLYVYQQKKRRRGGFSSSSTYHYGNTVAFFKQAQCSMWSNVASTTRDKNMDNAIFMFWKFLWKLKKKKKLPQFFFLEFCECFFAFENLIKSRMLQCFDCQIDTRVVHQVGCRKGAIS